MAITQKQVAAAASCAYDLADAMLAARGGK